MKQIDYVIILKLTLFVMVTLFVEKVQMSEDITYSRWLSAVSATQDEIIPIIYACICVVL